MASVFAWFEWHGGSYKTYPADPNPHARGLGGDLLQLLNLEDALATTELMRRVVAGVAKSSGSSMDHYWRHDLLAIADDGAGDLVAVQTTGLNEGCIYLHEKGEDLRPLAPSLAALTTRWIGQIDDGVVKWSPEQARWMSAGPDEPSRC